MRNFIILAAYLLKLLFGLLKFMLMKKLTFFLALAALACGCKVGKVSGRNGQDASSEVYAAVDGIYAEVIGSYDKGQKENYEEKFCSKEYYEIYRQTLKADERLSEQGYIGFFDHDHWIKAQDWGELSYEIKDVRIISQDKAQAKVVIKNLGHKKEYGIGLVKENGKWKIDDLGDKERMREYLRDNR